MAMMHPLTQMPASPLFVTPRSHGASPLRGVMTPVQSAAQLQQMMAMTRPGATGLQLGQVGSAPAPAIAAAVANLISNASLRASPEEKRSPREEDTDDKEKASMEETMKPLSQVYNDRTTGLLGCPLTVPKYSQRLKGSESPPRERRRVSPRPAPQKDFERAWERCHHDLYEDAFARQQRLRDMQSYVKQMEEDDHKTRMTQCQESIKQRRRYYRGRPVDGRGHLEREEENLRRRQEHQARCVEEQRMRELDELRGCTFRPCLVKKLSSSPTTPRQPGSSPRGLGSSFMDDAASSVAGYSVEYATTKLRNLVEAQQQAYGKLQALAQEEGPLKERLRALHSELHERIQREETSRVVAMLQDADSGSASQKDLVQRVRDMVAEGQDPESAQQMIVEELVMQSQDEVRRRVVEQFGPMRLEVEGELYSRQLAVAHELEALEAKAISLRGGTLCEEAKSLGFDFNLAAQVRQNLRSAPSIRRTTSVGSGSSAYPPRMSSAMSRVDSSISSQAEVTTLNGAKLAQAGKAGLAESPGSATKRIPDPPAQAAVTTASGDSSPIRRLQQGQRVILPNGMVAFAMPVTNDNAGASPRRLMHMMTGPLPNTSADSASALPQAADGSPRRFAADGAAVQVADSPSRRLQLASTSSLQEISPRLPEGGDVSPRRRVQMSNPPVEVISDVPRQPNQGDLVSPRQSMASLASMGSYQAPPSEGAGSVTVGSPSQQYRDKEAAVSKAMSSASSRAGSQQVPVQAVQSMQSVQAVAPPPDANTVVTVGSPTQQNREREVPMTKVMSTASSRAGSQQVPVQMMQPMQAVQAMAPPPNGMSMTAPATKVLNNASSRPALPQVPLQMLQQMQPMQQPMVPGGQLLNSASRAGLQQPMQMMQPMQPGQPMGRLVMPAQAPPMMMPAMGCPQGQPQSGVPEGFRRTAPPGATVLR